MKLECLKDKLRRGVLLAERVTGKNLSLAILGQIVLEAKGHVLIVKATNLDIGLEISLPAKVHTSGLVAVNGIVLTNFLSNLGGDDKIDLELVGNNLVIKTKNHSGLIKTQPVDDFPTLPRVASSQTFLIPIDALVNQLKAVAFAASYSDIKPEIASVYLHEHNKELWLVATDSFRLAEKKWVLDVDKLSEDFRLIIPIKNIAEISRIFEGLVESAELSFNKNQLSITTPNIFFTTRLIDGVYPDYRQIIPRESKTVVVALKTELLNALKLANIFSDRLNQVTIDVRVTDNQLEINSASAEIGEGSTRIDATLQGEDLQLSCNVKYLIDGFQSITSDSVSLKFNGKNRPLILSGIGDTSFNYLVMPLNR